MIDVTKLAWIIGLRVPIFPLPSNGGLNLILLIVYLSQYFKKEFRFISNKILALITIVKNLANVGHLDM